MIEYVVAASLLLAIGVFSYISLKTLNISL
ncbi:hypothetical protein M947_11035 [Sulfurimonas hongkongensis]|uniref:Uncharacterized protein n=1 Tax=Sulfurimonas hongkongensis TaxID=1172190 RepID=T0KLZ2_9BACT|nr:hypothetical protein M947_11035 [Sulfurimonas hongkongensis]